MCAKLLTIVTILFFVSTVHATTFHVTTNIDSVDINIGNGECADSRGRCSLRAAIQESNASSGAFTIYLPVGEYELNLSGDEEDHEEDDSIGDLDIRQDIEIIGGGKDSTFITASSSLNDRLFEIHLTSVHNVVFSGFTLSGGQADEGAAIYSDHANLRLSFVKIENNTAQESCGGLYINEGSASIESSVFNNNTTMDGGGGALCTFWADELSITNSKFSNNSILNGYSYGGALRIIHTNTEISDSLFFSNHSNEASGGAIGLAHSSVTINRSSFFNNEASGGAAIYAYSNYNDDYSLYIDNSTVSGNTATGQHHSEYPRGAIEITINYGPTVISNTTITNNHGAGLAVFSATAQIQNSILANNITPENKEVKFSKSMLLPIEPLKLSISLKTAAIGPSEESKGLTFLVSKMYTDSES